MTQLVKENTRYQMVNGRLVTSLIDHCYCSKPELVKSVSVAPITDSDHSGIWVTKYSQIPKQYPKQVQRRVFKNFDIKGYLEDLQKLEIEKEIEGMDVEEAAEILNTRITEVLDKYAPKKLIQNRNNYCPALTEETKKEIKVSIYI